ncbi:hypothetical protein JCM5353_002479 [Sporobolomyces roseus]
MHFSILFLLASSISTVLASVYIVKPDGSDSFNAGKRITVTWLDSETAPPASSLGPSTLYIATGSTTAHTNLATLAHISDPSKELETPITIDRSWGPESDQYFILLESDSAKDPNTNQPLQAFSARFQLNRMTGNFSSSVLAQIEGSSSSAPLTSSPGPSSSSSAVVGSSTSSILSTTKAAVENSASKVLTNSANGVKAVRGAGLAGLVVTLGIWML